MIDSFRDHYGFVERPFEDELTSFRHHFLGDPLYDPSLWFVAMDGDEMAGISICRAEDYENPANGFVNELGVRRQWRKRGIASALLKTSFAEFYRRGKRGAALGVDADSLTGALKSTNVPECALPANTITMKRNCAQGKKFPQKHCKRSPV